VASGSSKASTFVSHEMSSCSRSGKVGSGVRAEDGERRLGDAACVVLRERPLLEGAQLLGEERVRVGDALDDDGPFGEDPDLVDIQVVNELQLNHRRDHTNGATGQSG
jgi:hypothetical protein